MENFDEEPNSIENEISTSDLKSDLNVNTDGEKITDVVVETFSYPPRIEKYIELPVEEHSHRLKRQTENATAIDDDKALETSRAIENGTVSDGDAALIITQVDTSLGPRPVVTANRAKVLGLRVEESEKEPKLYDEMIPSVLRNTVFTLRLFGEGLSNDTIIAFTHAPAEYGMLCNHLLNGEYKVIKCFYLVIG